MGAGQSWVGTVSFEGGDLTERTAACSMSHKYLRCTNVTPDSETSDSLPGVTAGFPNARGDNYELFAVRIHVPALYVREIIR